MKILVLDFESYFADDYTLSKMSTEAYIRDPRFEAHGAALKFGPDLPARWWSRDELPAVFQEIDWANTFCISHHAHFDHLILNHRYNVRPAVSGCTLSMARLLLGNHLSVSLDSVRKHFGIPLKTTPYNLFRNKRWRELDPAVQKQVGDGACDEVESIWCVFNLLARDFPKEEYPIVDMVVKMFAQPVLRADMAMLRELWKSEAIAKQDAVQRLGITQADLQSAERFAQLLRERGEEPEMKDGKKGPIYAFAKSDAYMRDYLLEHDDEEIRALAAARIGVKSTLLQTRAETLAKMARRGLGGSDSPLPVYLRYAGAGTLRVSGGDGCLTADTQVLTLDIHGTLRYKAIVDVLLTDLVWDGEEFVEHEGVAFSGYCKVVEWDGLKGTPEHKVFCNETECALGEALRTKTPILDCREPTAWEVETARTRRCPSA